ncbi:tRNA lysidine(34) synthetase TilS [Buchnera aphidicola]|uniref:tRNA lysidine(34) synthetase TilS n=1 Tax=Buchnera aphidicola TaxID=9 RepID=UPI00094DB683|nr:tRNA lysidine(34) synthetase TilS [Buchnera aphidicola]
MIKNLFLKYPKNNLFLLALSGGIDSIVLLFQMLKWKKKHKKIKVRAIHINHHLNKNSERAQEYCFWICKKYKVPLIITDIPKQIKYIHGIEQDTRNKRYQIFKKFLLKNEVLLTAHHLNDQCENIFLAFKRKRGISSLAGIKYSNKINGIHIIRPLLNYDKKKITHWAKKKNLKWIEDKSNLNIKYDRNFIRHLILPKIYKRWPYFLKNCVNSIDILSEEREVLNIFLKKKLSKNIFIDGRLSLLNFKNMLKSLKFLILKLWIFNQSKIFPNANLLNRINNELIKFKNKKIKKIIFHEYEFYEYNLSLYCVLSSKKIKKNIFIWKNIFFPIKLPNNLGFLIGVKDKNFGMKIPKPKNKEIVTIQFQVTENIESNNKKNKKKIKNMWQKNKIPPWYRNKIPLIFYNHHLICALGVFNFTKKKEKTKKNIRILWFEPL